MCCRGDKKGVVCCPTSFVQRSDVYLACSWSRQLSPGGEELGVVKGDALCTSLSSFGADADACSRSGHEEDGRSWRRELQAMLFLRVAGRMRSRGPEGLKRSSNERKKRRAAAKRSKDKDVSSKQQLCWTRRSEGGKEINGLAGDQGRIRRGRKGEGVARRRKKGEM